MQLFCRVRNRLTCRKHTGLTRNPFQPCRSHPLAATTPWERTRSQEPYCPYKPSYMSVYLYALYLSTLFRYKFLRIKTSPRTAMMMMMAMEERVFIARIVCFCIIELREFCEMDGDFVMGFRVLVVSNRFCKCFCVRFVIFFFIISNYFYE